MDKYAWHGRFVPRDFPDGPLDAADSWRHSSGRTHGLDLHLQRFCRCAGPLPAGFLEDMLSLLSDGELFPRIASSRGLLLLDVRPAPPPRPHTRLTCVPAPDPRTQPTVKGPDFGALRAYRARYQLGGTDDTVIAPFGPMLETTTGALVAWDGDTLCIPDGVWLPSVTLHQVIRRAMELGHPVERRHLLPDAGMPLWFLNSLHGISPVSELHTETGVIRPPAHPATEKWQAWWWAGFS